MTAGIMHSAVQSMVPCGIGGMLPMLCGGRSGTGLRNRNRGATLQLPAILKSATGFRRPV